MSITEKSADTKPEFAEAASFIAVLTGEPARKARLIFQTFTDAGKGKKPNPDPLARVLVGTLPECWTELQRLNAKGAGVFVTVNEMRGRHRGKKHFKKSRAIFQEDDTGDAPPLPLDPQIVVESSPGKHHRYLLAETDDRDAWEAVQQTMVDDFGSDPNAKDCARVLRLPGTLHQKNRAAPFRVRLVHASPEPPYPWDEVTAAIPPAAVEQSGVSEAAGKPHAFREEDLRRMLKHITENERRHYWLKVIWALRRAWRVASVLTDYSAYVALADEYSKGAENYAGIEDVENKMREADTRDGPGIGFLWNEAIKGGFEPDAAMLARLHNEDPDGDFDEIEVEPAKIERPCIEMKPGKLHVYAKQLENLLSGELYERDHRLVRIGGAADLPGTTDDRETVGDKLKVRRNHAQPVILDAGTEYVIRRSGEIADLVAYRKREKEWAPVDCSAALARNIVEQKSWETMRKLNALASAPFVRPDLTVCTAPGYDDDTGVFYIPNADFPTVPESPTQKQAAEALATLLAPFDEFPFVSEACRAGFAANILTEAVRLAVDTVPVFAYTAPRAGVGKTMAAEMPARIVHGTEPAKRAWAEGDELRKVLFASLLVGDRSILFDNAKRGVKVRAPILCGFVTALMYSDRKLGVSEVPAMPNRAVVSMTGNNITPCGDLARRSVVVRQVADGDAAALRARRFKIRDLKSYVTEHRGELLTAALTVVRAFVAADCPEQAVPLPSFEQWSRLARDPLLWLGMADPVDTQVDETDDETAPLGEAFTALGEALQGREFTAGELVEICTGVADDSDLRKVLAEAGCSNPDQAREVGYWLRDGKDMEAGGWKLTHRKGARKWRFSQTNASFDGHDLI